MTDESWRSLSAETWSGHDGFILFKEEMDLLLDFIGKPDSSFKFENDENKGFSCLKKPLPFCLNPAKKGFQIDTC